MQSLSEERAVFGFSVFILPVLILYWYIYIYIIHKLLEAAKEIGLKTNS
jgi:hypothetical protein